jgi:uncharacterized protein YdeI (YjbR/CyaY-like superfamily)
MTYRQVEWQDRGMDTSRLKRPVHPVPDFVKKALRARGLTKLFQSRPPYQQNDYVGWITRAKLAATQQKRLEQMLDELERGDTYMKMHWHFKPRGARSR